MSRRVYQPRRRGLPRLELRHNRYHVALDVPTDARATVGKTRLVRSLGTSDPAVAERRAAPILAAWRKQIADVRGAAPIDQDDAAFFRKALRGARSPEERAAILERVADQAWEEGVTFADEDHSPAGAAAAFYASATAVPFVAYTDEWLATGRTTAKTKDMQRMDVKRFAAAFATVAEVNKPAVKKWVDSLMAEGLKAKTVQRVLSALRGYWKHLQAIEAAPAALDPFSKLNLARQGGRVSQKDRRQPFSAADVVKLVDAARSMHRRGDDDLAALIELARWTGARIEELCSLRIEDVHLAAPIPYFVVIEAKTEAGIREVPIHLRLLPIVKRLIGERKTGYVLAKLTANKYEDRGGALGTRFGRLKTRLGFDDRYVFHSIRKTVASILKDASVPEATTADILGHELRTMSYGVYATSVSLQTKAAALAKLRYPI